MPPSPMAPPKNSKARTWLDIESARLRKRTARFAKAIEKQAALKYGIRQIGRQRPTKTFQISAPKILRYRCAANRQGSAPPDDQKIHPHETAELTVTSAQAISS